MLDAPVVGCVVLKLAAPHLMKGDAVEYLPVSGSCEQEGQQFTTSFGEVLRVTLLFCPFTEIVTE
jgi:hypothetical protein